MSTRNYIRPGALVRLDYVMRGPDGEEFDRSEPDEPMEYLHGHEEIPPALERALDGLEVGASKVVALGPGDIVPVQLQDDEGHELDGESIDMKVVEISPDAIVLDANHPLAGQAVTFEVTILSVELLHADEIAKRKKD